MMLSLFKYCLTNLILLTTLCNIADVPVLHTVPYAFNVTKFWQNESFLQIVSIIIFADRYHPYPKEKLVTLLFAPLAQAENIH